MHVYVGMSMGLSMGMDAGSMCMCCDEDEPPTEMARRMAMTPARLSALPLALSPSTALKASTEAPCSLARSATLSESAKVAASFARSSGVVAASTLAVSNVISFV